MGEAALALSEQLPEARLAIVDQAPLALRVDQLAQDRQSRLRYMRWASGLVMRETVEDPRGVETALAPTSLAATIDKLAANPDLAGTEDDMLIDINVGTATIEACFKKHVKRVPISVNEQGEFVQFGQTAQETHANSIVERPHRRPELQAFTHAEALNGHRDEDLYRDGIFEDYWKIVPSLVPTDLPEKDLGVEGEGYFLNGMTFALQGTTAEQGEIVVEAVFDDGVENGEALTYKERQAQRFDIKALARVYERFGLEAPEDPLDFLQNPLLIHKSLLKNGMVDFLRMVHEEHDKLMDRSMERTEEEYLDIIEQSAIREASLEDTKRKIKEELLGYAGTFTKPLDAVDRLWDLVKKHVVEESVLNQHIDPKVFGKGAEEAIHRARLYASMGDMSAMQTALQEAHEKAEIVGCGGGSGSKAGKVEGGDEEQSIPDEIRCIKCGEKSPSDKVVGQDTWHCPHCKYEVDVCTGAVVHESVPPELRPTDSKPAAILLDYFRHSSKGGKP
jgi:hypothetical protein